MKKTVLLILAAIIFVFGLATLFAPKILCCDKPEYVYRVKSDLHTISTALEMFKSAHGHYPIRLTDLVGEGGYLDLFPLDPWGNSYIYKVSTSDGGGYELISLGKDQLNGGESENRDLSLPSS
ncbi:type II secretion system protein GspG [Agaribacterium sp. ZY112]|uniref:type II secretion system protein GspG n=1 Tax=Agaribacterium sp. ZY112 TaxID=3233574 RepID=UPI003524E74E